MESSAAKRQKMNEPAQTSFNTVNSSINMSSSYIDHYNKTTYIDKTLLIEKLFQIPEYTLITAPRRFGKSLNMNMVRKFLEIEVNSNGNPIVLQRDEVTGYLLDNQSTSRNFELFKGKKIFENKKFVSKHFGQYPTIFVDFKRVVGINFQEILRGIRDAICQSFQEHAYLIHCPIWGLALAKANFMRYFHFKECESLDAYALKTGLEFLSECLHAHFGKGVYVFIDEFDAPLSHMIYTNEMNCDDRKHTIDFFTYLFPILLKDNPMVRRSLLTGCNRAHQILVGRTNIWSYPFMEDDRICEFYGFEEAEVKFLLDKSGLPEYQFTNIRKWYNGYKRTLKDGRTISIYNPYAVLMYLYEKKLSSCWSVNVPDMVLEAMSHYGIRPIIVSMMTSRRRDIRIDSMFGSLNSTDLSDILVNSSINRHVNCDLFIIFLYQNGFFNLLRFDSDNNWLIFEISNEAIYSAIDNCLFEAKFIKKYYHHCHDRKKIDHFTTSMKELSRLRTKSAVINLAKSIEELCRNTPDTCYDELNEFDIPSVFYVYLKECNKYTTTECTTSTRTRCDMLTVINEVVFIIEFKFNSHESQEAYNQIFTSKYISLLVVEKLREFFEDDKLNFKNKIYLGIHVSNDCNVTITFSIDDEGLKESNINVSSNSPGKRSKKLRKK